MKILSINCIVIFFLILMFSVPVFSARGQKIDAANFFISCLERIDIVDKHIFKEDDNTVKILSNIVLDNKEKCDFVKYLKEAQKENILSSLLDLIDPEKRLNIYVVKDHLEQNIEIYLRDSQYGVTKDASLFNRCIVVLGGYYQLRNYAYDDKIFISWMKKSLENNGTGQCKDDVLRYVFPYMQPDKNKDGVEKNRTHYLIGENSQDERKNLAPDYLFIINHTIDEDRLEIVIPSKDKMIDGERIMGECYEKYINIYPKSKELKNELQLLLFFIPARHPIFSV